MRPNLPGDEDRWFWPRVDKSGECWLWTGAIGSDGYGMVKMQGKQCHAHRIALGSPPGWVLHHCDVQLCCRPSHLYVGDAKDNARDRKERNRNVPSSGEMNGQAKLTERDVQVIRAGGDPKELCKRYGVTISHVYRIRRGERW